MDFLDAAVDLEGTAFEQGRQMGAKAADEGDMRQQGSRGGFNRAYPLALELGFLEASVEDGPSDDDTAPPTATPTATTTATPTATTTAAAVDVGTGDASGQIAALDLNPANAAAAALGDDWDSGGGPPTVFLTKRAQKRKLAILSKIAAIPNSNQVDMDYDKELLELRALYRLSGTKNGRFLPTPTASTSASASASTAVGAANTASASGVDSATEAEAVEYAPVLFSTTW